MVFLRAYALVVLLLAVGFDLVYALSSPPRPIRPPFCYLRHDDAFRLIISAFGDDFYLHLRPNDHLIHPAARIVHYSHTEPLLRESVKAYLGHVIHSEFSEDRIREDAARVVHSAYPESELGWARIMVHDQGDAAVGRAPVFEGAFTVGGVVHHVVTKENYLRKKLPLDPELVGGFDDQLVIWRDSDVMSFEEEQLALTGKVGSAVMPASCGHDNLPYNNVPLRSPPMSPWPTFGMPPNTSIYRRDDVAGGSMDTKCSARANAQQLRLSYSNFQVYMGVAADCEYVSAYASKENATQQILTNWNTASSTYKSTFNVSLGIIELQVQDTTCPSSTDQSMAWNVACSDSITLNDRLSLFSQWRGTKSDSAGLWHLMSGCPTGSEVGIAWLAVLCQQTTTGSQGSFVSGTGVSTNGRTEWQIVAHEIGHNFGAIHDCADGCSLSDSCCPLTTSTCNADSKFIMSPVSQSSENSFSQCSLGNICSVLGGDGGVNTTCLIDASQARDTISLQMCGNGIVEDGEDCDPGLGVTSSCCDSSTCKFTNGAVCDPASSACCTQQCSFAPASTVCRAAKDARCDTAETCTGTSSACPADTFSPNGQSCGDGGLACASGQCTSVSQQCKTVGASMNLTQACSKSVDNSCQVTCQDPSSSSSCIQLNALLIDGSPCGYGGTCQSGSCKSGSALDTALSWYRQNLQIAIPVTIVVGLIVLAILYYILRALWRCMTGRRGAKPVATVVGANPTYSRLRHERLESFDRAVPTYMVQDRGPYASTQPPAAWAQPGAPVSGHGRNRSSRSNWVDVSAYNGSR
ncbi:hypothetical protein BDZ89DRAFT_1080658 [Hymenopellis radicata]|nr:hypothetical protein BDZ89DRAFT_1080658 [Hymenopellis radicata]